MENIVIKKRTFNVSLELVIDADNPLEAARLAEEWIEDRDKWIYIVQDNRTKEIFSVDTNEDDEDAVFKYEDYKPFISAKMP